jgi:hypothetical protein
MCKRQTIATARVLGFAALNPTTPVNMLAVKSLLPDKGSMRALQSPLPAQRPLQLPLTFRAATVAVAVAASFEVAVAVAVNPR